MTKWESVGYREGLAGKEFNPPRGAPMTVRDSYRIGWQAGDIERRVQAARGASQCQTIAGLTIAGLPIWSAP